MKRLESSSAPRSSKTAAKDDKSKHPPAKKSGFSFLSLEASMNDKTLEVFRSDTFVCIRDKFPKSRIHLLLIPLPVGGKKLLKVEHIIQLDKSVQFLAEMKALATQIITERVLKASADLQEADFKIGFHSVQSMAPLHLHILSRDFKSDCLKTKKHWNSFNTDYFIELDVLIEHLKGFKAPAEYFKTDRFALRSPDKLEACLKLGLKCHVCQAALKNMPELKKHLNTH